MFKERYPHFVLIQSVVFLLGDVSCFQTQYSSEQLVSMPGHMKRFGYGRPTHIVDEIQGFPTVRDFIENYVLESKPLVMRGAGVLSPGFNKWETDDYFLSLPVPADNEVTVETRKKENRTQKTLLMNFKDFIRTYNETEQYMVTEVPNFLLDDVSIPGPLQCKQINNELIIENLMWFSSGGTKSVVHTDSAENINCLYRGEKEYVMVDPGKHIDKIDIDHPEGAYSGIDVDKADYTKYPGLADVEYYNVNTSAGDCIYIPFKWIHAVRSHNRNIAVNIWWNAYKNKNIDLTKCQAEFDPSLTLSSVEVHGFEDIMNSAEAIREQITSSVRREKKLDFDRLLLILPEFGQRIDHVSFGHKEMLSQLLKGAFAILDKNSNGILEQEDVNQVTDQEWEDVRKLIERVEDNLSYLEERFESSHEDNNMHEERDEL